MILAWVYSQYVYTLIFVRCLQPRYAYPKWRVHFHVRKLRDCLYVLNIYIISREKQAVVVVYDRKAKRPPWLECKSGVSAWTGSTLCRPICLVLLRTLANTGIDKEEGATGYGRVVQILELQTPHCSTWGQRSRAVSASAEQVNVTDAGLYLEPVAGECVAATIRLAYYT